MRFMLATKRNFLFLLLITFNSLAAIGAVYYFTKVNSSRMPHMIREKNNKRFNHMMASWNLISKDPDTTTLFLGTSIFQYFLDPRVFDSHYVKADPASNSFNLAFEGNVGAGTLAFINRLKTESKSKDVKFNQTIFELCVSCLNKRFYNNHKSFIEISHPKIFLDRKAWRSLFISDPLTAIYLQSIQLFSPFDWIYMFFDKRSPKFPGVAGVFSRKDFYERPEWNIATKGLTNWNFPQSKEEFYRFLEELHSEEKWKEAVNGYVRGNNITNSFAYQESLIQDYIDAVNTAKSFSSNVYIVKLPHTPSFQKIVDQYVDENYVMSRIEKRTGIKVFNYTKRLNLTDDDFADPMHLKQDTMNEFLSILSEDISKSKNQRESK